MNDQNGRTRLSVWVVVMLVCAVGFLGVAPGCGKPPSGKNSGDGGGATAYDPRTDPLVNPASMLEVMPEDRSMIDEDDTLKWHLNGSPNTLNPIFVSSMYDFTVVDVLFAGLFTFNAKMEWEVNEHVVESIEESADHTTFTVKMKPGLTWQDGEAFDAHDVVYTWKAILDENVPCHAQKPSVEPITECVAIDDLTVKFVQDEPLATSRWNLLFPVLPQHIFEKHQGEFPDLQTGEYYNGQQRNPVGNGPYKVVEWKENDRIVVERWDDYFGDKPAYKKIIFRIIPDSNVSLLSFEKQDVDTVQLTAQQFAEETSGAEFAKAGFKAWAPEWSFSYLGYNMDGSNPFFTDALVRRAMTHATNIDLMIEKITYNLYTQSTGNYHPDSWMYNPEIELLTYDLEKSAALLDEAGWMIDDDDGWRYKEIDGVKVKFDFTMLLPQGSSTGAKVAAIMQADLKKLGVQMQTRTMEWASFLKKVREHEFQAETAAWGTGTDPDTGRNLWMTDQYDGGRNYGGYSNARVDELFIEGQKEFDPAKRAAIYQEIHKLIYDDQPYTWLFYRPTLQAVNKRIKGVSFSPRGINNFNPGSLGWWSMK